MTCSVKKNLNGCQVISLQSNLLSGPLLSGRLSISRNLLPIFTVNMTSIQRSPLLSGHLANSWGWPLNRGLSIDIKCMPRKVKRGLAHNSETNWINEVLLNLVVKLPWKLSKGTCIVSEAKRIKTSNFRKTS